MECIAFTMYAFQKQRNSDNPDQSVNDATWLADI